MPEICKGGTPLLFGGDDGGVVLPWVHIESQALGSMLYLVGLVWCFLGVGIIADIFMCAIEKVTSSKKRVKRGDRVVTVKRWNGTVANLTLMALGSSAPEILLSLVELMLTENFHSGALGPSTIVGSAAFNLLIITAICVLALPAGEERKVRDVAVFGTTASFSVFAYLWLVFILLGPSPHVVEVWEGVLTFLFFPLLVFLAYLADVGWFHKLLGKMKKGRLVFTPDTTKEEFDEMLRILREKYGRIPEEPANREALLRYEFTPGSSRAVRRIEATRQIAGAARVAADDKWLIGKDLVQRMRPTAAKRRASSVHPDPEEQVEPKTKAIFSLATSLYAVSEAAKRVNLRVLRTGNTDMHVVCKYRTRDGTAIEGEDYLGTHGSLEFGPGEQEKAFDVGIVKDKKHEPTEEFYVDIKSADPELAIVGQESSATVVVLDSNDPGVLAWQNEEIQVPEVAEPTLLIVTVLRKQGACGIVGCSYRTEDGTAKAGKDFSDATGKLEFKEGQLEASFKVEILPLKHSQIDKKLEQFRIILDKPTGQVLLDPNTDGGMEENILTVTIVGDPDGQKRYNFLMRSVNWDGIAIGRNNWRDQFVAAIYVGGSRDEQADAGVLDWIMHVLSLPWKVLFAVVPPTDFGGGWVCFVCALAMIGLLTAVIGDMANLLGCALDMKPSICAVTFVALGTSLPDTFASKTAAQQDSTADNSIGNVTGSNSVNVFLGLGLPWTIGALYWAIKGAQDEPGDPWYARGREMGWLTEYPEIAQGFPHGAFVVPAGNLGSSVGVFSGCAVLCISTLVLRRKMVGAELGGPTPQAWTTSIFFVFLWLLYVGMSIYFEGGLGPYA